MGMCRLLQTRRLAMGVMVVSFHLAGQTVCGRDLDSDGWRLSLTPYLWFSGIEGDVKVNENKARVDVGFEDIWDALDFGGLIRVEAQKSRCGLFLDTIYLATSTDRDLNVVTATLDVETWIVEFGGFYRLGDWRNDRGFPMLLDVLVGGRYWSLDTELDIGPLSRSSDTDWVDPFVGLRWIAQLTDRLGFYVRGDVGGFAVDDDASEFSWQVEAGPAVKLSRNMTLMLVYRALEIDREEGNDLETDITLSGPEIGLHIQF